MLKRLLGIIMMVIGLVGVAVSILGGMGTRQVVDDIAAGIDNSLALVSASLDTINDTFLLTRQLVGQATETLDTVNESATNLSQTINQTRPLIDQVGDISAGTVPDGIESVQAAIPNIAEVAATIDTTMRLLSDFQVNQRILGVPIRFDLGIQYDPSVPFDETILAMGDSLEGLPAQLRSLRIYLNVTNNNLQTISDDVRQIAGDLKTINKSVAEVQPLLDDYITIVTEVNDNIRVSRANLTDQFEDIKTGLLVFFIWLGLAQAAPLYLGFELLRGKELSDEAHLVRRDELAESALAAETELPVGD